MREHEKLLDGLVKQYMSEGMSEFDARLRAIMSDESLSKVFPREYDEGGHEGQDEEDAWLMSEGA